MTPEELSAALEDILTEAERRMARALSRNDRAALNDLLDQVGRLKRNKAGNIAPTTENLRIKVSIRNNLNKIIFGTEWQTGVAAVASGIGKIETLLETYFAQWGRFNAGPAFRATAQSAIDSVRLTMSGQGWGSSVVNTVGDILETAVTNALTPRELIGQLQDFIRQGGLQTFNRVSVKQVATDAMGQFSRTYMKMAADRVKIDWFRYSGGLIRDSRSFCKSRNGNYYHRSEIESWPKLKWDGKIKGTNKGNIYAYLGGWNCQHTLTPVATSAVPKTDRERIP